MYSFFCLCCYFPTPCVYRNVLIDDKSKDDEEEKSGTPDGKPDATTPTGKKKDKSKDKPKDDKDKRKPSAGKGKSSTVGRRGSHIMTTPPPGGALTPGSEVDGQRFVFKLPIVKTYCILAIFHS